MLSNWIRFELVWRSVFRQTLFRLHDSQMVLYALPTYSNWSKNQLDQNTWLNIYLRLFLQTHSLLNLCRSLLLNLSSFCCALSSTLLDKHVVATHPLRLFFRVSNCLSHSFLLLNLSFFCYALSCTYMMVTLSVFLYKNFRLHDCQTMVHRLSLMWGLSQARSNNSQSL